jgi:hypothetical protein
VARLLLDHGADPNAGYLWEGLVPPFTALTGVLGSGEGASPKHREEPALERLLLERGADPNDDQALFNRAGTRGDGWLELLFEFGLGSGDGGPWRRLLGDRQASPREMVEDLLICAAPGHTPLSRRAGLARGDARSRQALGRREVPRRCRAHRRARRLMALAIAW